MAHDTGMADRLRELLAAEPDVVEKRVVGGGLGFLVGGYLAVSVSGRGGLLVRVDPARAAELLADPRASQAVMGGREMPGWLRVDLDAHAADDELGRWVRLGVERVRSLPPR